MNKRGQVTLFIIIAIVIVAIIVFLIIFQRSRPIQGPELPSSDLSKVKSYMTECLGLKAKQGLIMLGKQGGYYDLDEFENINFLDEETAYYWKANQILVPSKEKVEQELNSWLNENIDFCFIYGGYQIEREECSADSELSEKVSITFECPVTIKKESATSKIERFLIEFDFPTSKFLNVSDQIVQEYSIKPGYFCVSCYDEIALGNDVTITAVPVTKETFEPEHIWFLITDKNIKFEEQNITWRFVIEM